MFNWVVCWEIWLSGIVFLGASLMMIETIFMDKDYLLLLSCLSDRLIILDHVVLFSSWLVNWICVLSSYLETYLLDWMTIWTPFSTWVLINLMVIVFQTSFRSDYCNMVDQLCFPSSWVYGGDFRIMGSL